MALASCFVLAPCWFLWMIGGYGGTVLRWGVCPSFCRKIKKILLLDVDPQGGFTKMLGQRKPHNLPPTLANAMNDVVSETMPRDHPEIMHHHEGFDFVAGNRSLSAVEVGLVNVMSRETVLRQYVDSVKQYYDYVLLDCRPSLGMVAQPPTPIIVAAAVMTENTGPATATTATGTESDPPSWLTKNISAIL